MDTGGLSVQVDAACRQSDGQSKDGKDLERVLDPHCVH